MINPETKDGYQFDIGNARIYMRGSCDSFENNGKRVEIIKGMFNYLVIEERAANDEAQNTCAQQAAGVPLETAADPA